MILTRLFLAIAFSAVWIGQAQASIIVNFDEVATSTPNNDIAVDGFYNGGASSDSVFGLNNLGVDFSTGEWITGTGFGETTAPNFALSNSVNSFVNVAAGFESFSFTYGAFTDTTINVWSGLGGTGTPLGSFKALANAPVPVFDSATISFTGTAMSISVEGGLGTFAWDDLEFGSVSAVPEPASICIWGLGLLGACFVSRRKRLNPKA